MSDDDIELEDVHLPAIAQSKRKLLPVRSSQDLARQDLTQELEKLVEHQPERVAEIVREWIKEKQ